MPEFITVEEFSERLDITRNYVYIMVRAGKLPHVKLGKHIRINWTRYLEDAGAV